jgi:endonuclease YncB( thermonuclease family)
MNSDTLMGCMLWLIIITFIVVIPFWINRIYTKVESAHQSYKIHMGELFVIDGDTLTIVDYSLFRESFILSNGTRVNYYLISSPQTEGNK